MSAHDAFSVEFHDLLKEPLKLANDKILEDEFPLLLLQEPLLWNGTYVNEEPEWLHNGVSE